MSNPSANTRQILDLIELGQYQQAADRIDETFDDLSDDDYDRINAVVLNITDTNGFGLLMDAMGGDDPINDGD
jgi:hypothetical protein